MEKASQPVETTLAQVPSIEDLLSRMTLPEKLGQMTQHPYGIGDPDEILAAAQKGTIGSFLNVRDLDVRNRLQRAALEESRLGIPLIFGRDVIHGYKTIFPIPLGQAATFNPDVVERAAAVAAAEASFASGVPGSLRGLREGWCAHADERVQ